MRFSGRVGKIMRKLNQVNKFLPATFDAGRILNASGLIIKINESNISHINGSLEFNLRAFQVTKLLVGDLKMEIPVMCLTFRP